MIKEICHYYIKYQTTIVDCHEIIFLVVFTPHLYQEIVNINLDLITLVPIDL